MNEVWNPLTPDAEEAAAAGPYPGLRPFLSSERNVFFGREQMIDEVLVRLNEHHMVVVHGASGCGKSSLVAAGVLPHLAHRRARRGLNLQVGRFRPENRPMHNLVHTLARLCRGAEGTDEVEAIYRTLSAAQRARAALAVEARARGIDQVCIVVDQFEELFRFAEEGGHEQAERFAELLVLLADVGVAEPPWWEDGENKPEADIAGAEISFILTMRSEFLGDCSRYPGLAEVINRTQYLLPNMEQADLIRAIREPAEVFGGFVEHRLAERIADDAAREQDPLPLVQHALLQLWKESSSGRLTEADYDQSIGNSNDEQPSLRSPLAAILACHADTVLAEVTDRTPEKLAAAEFIFRALSKKDSESRAIRCPQKFRRLVQLSALSEDETRKIVDGFRRDGISFLTPYEVLETSVEPDTVIDISHEALMRAWPRMSDRSINPETTRPIGWVEREAQDAILWRWLAVHADLFRSNSRAYLDGTTTERLTDWFEAIRVRPEWARRHLLHPTGEKDVTQEPEWKAVTHLLNESARKNWLNNTMIKRWRKLSWITFGLFLLAAGAIASGAVWWYFWHQPAEEEAQLKQARDETTTSIIATDYLVQKSNDQRAPNSRSAVSERVSDRIAAAASTGDGGAVLVSEDTDGYIWIGTIHSDGSVTSNIARARGSSMSPADVTPNRAYYIAGNTVVRADYPNENYTPDLSIGLITANSGIRVMALPRNFPRGDRVEYWVKARLTPTSFPNVRLEHVNGEGGGWQTLRSDLDDIGYRIAPEPNATATGRAEVVYCHETDRAAAVRLASTASRSLTEIGRTVAPIAGTDCGAQPSGTLRLIIDLAPPSSAGPSAGGMAGSGLEEP